MIPAGTKVYLAVAPTDLRCSFDGLAAKALSVLGHDPRAGGMFVFINKRGNQARVLFCDRHGMCLLAKRLDRGRFRAVQADSKATSQVIDGQGLIAFLDDIIVGKTRAGHRASQRKNRETRLRIVPALPKD